MKLAHIAVATPFRCGLYETTRELVKAERDLGVDARIIDPAPVEQFYPKGGEDRGVPLDDMEWATQADLIVSHSGHDGTPVAETGQPIIHVAHGRPLSTFLGEREGGAPAYSYQVNRSQDERYRACVTFWPEYEPYLRILWGRTPVHVIPPPVDLEHWSPEKTKYDFMGKGGAYNVVMTDPWCRRDVSPFAAINAFALFRHMVPDARLHCYAIEKNTKGFGALFSVLGKSIGVLQGWAKDLRMVYRAADMLITPHRIYTRSVREALACDCQVVCGRDADPEDIEQFAMKMVWCKEHPAPSRQVAEAWFNPLKSARRFMGVVESVLSQEVMAIGD